MKQRTMGILTSMIFLMSAGANASSIRVETLGSEGLVADKETDIQLNPAYSTLVKSRRLFAGLDYSREKVMDYGTVRQIYQTSSFYVEPLFCAGENRYSLRVTPFFSSSRHDDASQSLLYRTEAPLSARFLFARAFSDRWAGGATAGYSKQRDRSQFSSSLFGNTDSEQDGDTWTASLGLLANASPGARQGLSLGLEKSASSASKGPSLDEDSQIWTARWMADGRVNEKASLRGLFSSSDNQSSIDYAGSRMEDHSVTSSGGVGLAIRADPSEQWLLTVHAGHLTARSKIDGVTSNRYRAQSGELKAGVEKDVLQGKVTLRAAATLLYAQSDVSQGATAKSTRKTFEGPLRSYVLGLGVWCGKDLLLDLNFNSLASSRSIDRYEGASSSHSVRSVVEVAVAVTSRF